MNSTFGEHNTFEELDRTYYPFRSVRDIKSTGSAFAICELRGCAYHQNHTTKRIHVKAF